MKIKVKFNGETRVLSLSDNDDLWSQFINNIYIKWPQLKNHKFNLSYFDDEGDEISFSSNNELESGIQLAHPNLLKVVVNVSEEDIENDIDEDDDNKSDHSFALIENPEKENPEKENEQVENQKEEEVIEKNEEVNESNDESIKVENIKVEEKKVNNEQSAKEQAVRFVCLLIDFLQCDSMQVRLQNVINKLINNPEKNIEMIHKILKEDDIIYSHDLIQCYLPKFEDKLVEILKMASISPGTPLLIAMFLPALLSKLPGILGLALDSINQANDNDDFETLMRNVFRQSKRDLFGQIGNFPNQNQNMFGNVFEDDDANAKEEIHKDNKTNEDEEQALPWTVRAAHKAICDECKKDITDIRYMCTICQDYDLCQACEEKSTHNPDHAMMKVRVPFDPIHFNVQCDGCGLSPISGHRYKCAVCSNYDLCSDCEKKQVHHPGHPLLKIKQPWDTHHGNFNKRACKRFGGRGFGAKFGGRHGRCGPLKGKKRFLKRFLKSILTADCNVDNKNTANCNVNTKHGKGKGRGKRGIKVKYIKDLTMPDDVIVSPNQVMVKTWLLKTKGLPEGTKLIFLRGDREVSSEEEFDVPTGVKGEIELNAIVNTPSKAGKYQAYFSLADADRLPFGPRLWVHFEVQNNEESGLETKQEVIDESKQIVEEQPKEVTNEVKPEVKKEESKYSKELNVLAQLGFKDATENERLLEAFNGNISNTLEYLFEKQKNPQITFGLPLNK